ncbi:mannose-1-phosphate guanylyltransferase [Candidatus Uabimicrobium amorphum]|uniref:mannose-1-phosphate guanylyltransferase n=1 Tax=Uabimicrobium amorphum TaxID=2596890 RepID=A0A5S9IQS8_UABAM|nr:sugar phosphate nucleotidyltransferase [Candidatus Uabimicrobium amorphum]BBM86007.1 mannose-1-phosphate guanylyltransferase [Candidatus Uabimicrobium amorphum]
MQKLDNTHIVIMAGGGGTRFWPASRNIFPKQFLKLVDDTTMLRNTLQRVFPLVEPENIWILTNHLYKDIVIGEAREIPQKNVIVEPLRRDTAAAVMLAASIVKAENPKANMFVMPADHVITPQEKFHDELILANEYLVEHDSLFTFGIAPTYPSPQFGYIKVDAKDTKVTSVRKFVEKPTIDVAKEYLQQGKYFWNSGIFAWKVSTIVDKFARFLPQHYQGIETLSESWNGDNWQQNLEKVFSSLPSISIDYGIMEKEQDVFMLQASFSWNDVGSWEALESLHPGENSVVGEHIGIDTKNCVIYSGKQLVATIGVEDLVVAATEDAILVVPKNQTSKIKKLVSLLKEQGQDQYL